MKNKKFVAWGVKLHTDTYSYIHDSYCKAFASLGWESVHYDGTEKNVDIKDSVVMVSNHYENTVPLHPSNKYITHNCMRDEFKNYKRLSLQVYTNGTNSAGSVGEKINDYTVFDNHSKTLYQPWATDLLPDEIDVNYHSNNSKKCVWVGSLNNCPRFGNLSKIHPFIDGIKTHGFHFNHINPWSNPVSHEKNRQLVFESEVAPTLVGQWQLENDYIPCRFFKNISYGKLCLTNSPIIVKLLNDSVVYGEGKDLVDRYLSLNQTKQKIMFEHSINEIKTNHTFKSRVEQILKVI